MGNVELFAEHGAGPVHFMDPFGTRGGAIHATVVTVQPAFVVLYLQPSPWAQVTIRLSIEPRPICDASAQSAGVDKVKLSNVIKDPVALSIVNVESKIGRNPGGLDGRKIGADDRGRREEIGTLDCPDSSARADVENALR